MRLADVFHSPFHVIPEQVSGIRRLAKFLTIYDLAPVLYPRLCSPYQICFMKEILESLSPDSWVLCISQSTKDDLCNAAGLDPHRVFVTHLAASSRLFHPCTDSEAIASVRGKYGIPDGPYVLGLNTLEPRKNIQHLILAFARLTQEQSTSDLSLVLVGARGWLGSNIQELVSQMEPRVRDRVVITGYVVDEDLAALYSGALVFVYPSFYEGFGLPPLEAMQCGTPVITSNTSSLPEVVGDAGIMLDPTDLDGLCHSLYSVYSQSQLREKLSRQSIAQARQFGWLRSAQQTLEAYKEAL
jgi:glycosyltransferase involved in cell wall biosynthesis